MNKQQHTPKIPKGYPITGEIVACKAKEGYALCSGDFEVALVNLDALSPDASRDYALSIVRAVNSHQALIEALGQAHLAVQELCNDQDPANECWNVLRQIENALEQAKCS